ncbi:unnamed protein product [Bursaphelenchus xylophilus]|uniref:(pine wood nematode) hypothetical protein n=1 Tax=Bursaphelenchus xylophilus TaxID=6326 RepID=A0A1I7S728_BURXY|nr:unnamed protein product [Bursaphelenchus xylophilus]CAG9084531.1 unnamed protein product [Bursaphelenchus xylophilus]
MTTKSNAECEAAIKEFTELTNTDEAFAHFILQDVDYDLEAGVYKYFTEINTDAPLPDQIIKEVLDHLPQSASQQADGGPENAEEIPPEFSVVSWNIDGLNKDALNQRFLAVITILARHNPEVIFFQEFVAELDSKMREILGKMYNVYEGSKTFHYYTVTLVSKNITIFSNKVKHFKSSGMGRNMLIVEGKWKALDLFLINTHLESEKQSSEIRKEQFKQCMDEVEMAQAKNKLVLFGGDLNIRDREVTGLPRDVKDCWVAAGSSESSRYTWDMSKNDNLEFPDSVRYKLRCRFDRFYVSSPYKRIKFNIDGQERIKTLRLFPSDHFAIVAKFSEPAS